MQLEKINRKVEYAEFAQFARLACFNEWDDLSEVRLILYKSIG